MSQVTPSDLSFGAVAFGANLPSLIGAADVTLTHAIARFAALVQAPKISRLFATPAFPAGSGPEYVNAVVAFSSDLSATALLDLCHRIEAETGRERTQRWGARVLDLDLLFLGDLVCPSLHVHQSWVDLPLQDRANRTPDQLILPHPRIADRGFVLVPLLDVAPDWVHPVTGLTPRAMHSRLSRADLAGIRPHG